MLEISTGINEIRNPQIWSVHTRKRKQKETEWFSENLYVREYVQHIYERNIKINLTGIVYEAVYTDKI
jgi:hypothetical protein